MSIENIGYDLRRILHRGGTVKVRPAATALTEPTPITSITDDGAGTATVVATAHGLSTSDSVRVFGAYEARFNGTFTITVTDANTFTYTVASSAAGTSTGQASVVERSTLPAADRFETLGLIRDAEIDFEPVTTSKSTSGKEHAIGTDFEIMATMMQTADEEFAALDEMTNQPMDIAVFGKGCATQHTDKGDLVADLHNGFLVYGVLLKAGGKLDLNGGESGIQISTSFFVGNDHGGLVVGA